MTIMHMRSTPSTVNYRKEYWRGELSKTRATISTLSDYDVQQVLNTLVENIRGKITRYNGETTDYPIIEGELSDLRERIQTHLNWQKRITLLESELEFTESNQLKIACIQSKIKTYTGNTESTSEINARDRKSTRLNSSHIQKSRMPSSA